MAQHLELVRLLVFLPLAVGSTACIYSPADGSDLSTSARVDGSPPPFNLFGGYTNPGVVIEVEAWNWTRSSWDRISEEVVGSGFVDPENSVYGWRAEDLKVRNLEHVTVDATTGKQHIRLRGRSTDRNGTLATFDASGLTCLYERIAAGVPGLAAGQECTTGNQLDLYYEDYAGGSLPLLTLDDIQGCSSGAALKAFPEEAGHRYAQRVTPPSYPFTVDEIRYNLLHDVQPGGQNEGCRADQPHAVEMFVVPHGAGPTADPIEVFRYPVTAATPGSSLTVVTHTLPATLTLEEGEDLFVAFEMAYEDEDSRVCLSSCFDPATHVATNHYWSNSTTSPYPWVTLASFGPGVNMNPQVWVRGFAG